MLILYAHIVATHTKTFGGLTLLVMSVLIVVIEVKLLLYVKQYHIRHGSLKKMTSEIFKTKNSNKKQYIEIVTYQCKKCGLAEMQVKPNFMPLWCSGCDIKMGIVCSATVAFEGGKND